jgi:hypothetical protein
MIFAPLIFHREEGCVPAEGMLGVKCYFWGGRHWTTLVSAADRRTTSPPHALSWRADHDVARILLGRRDLVRLIGVDLGITFVPLVIEPDLIDV